MIKEVFKEIKLRKKKINNKSQDDKRLLFSPSCSVFFEFNGIKYYIDNIYSDGTCDFFTSIKNEIYKESDLDFYFEKVKREIYDKYTAIALWYLSFIKENSYINYKQSNEVDVVKQIANTIRLLHEKDLNDIDTIIATLSHGFFTKKWHKILINRSLLRKKSKYNDNTYFSLIKNEVQFKKKEVISNYKFI